MYHINIDLLVTTGEKVENEETEITVISSKKIIMSRRNENYKYIQHQTLPDSMVGSICTPSYSIPPNVNVTVIENI